MKVFTYTTNGEFRAPKRGEFYIGMDKHPVKAPYDFKEENRFEIVIENSIDTEEQSD